MSVLLLNDLAARTMDHSQQTREKGDFELSKYGSPAFPTIPLCESYCVVLVVAFSGPLANGCETNTLPCDFHHIVGFQPETIDFEGVHMQKTAQPTSENLL